MPSVMMASAKSSQQFERVQSLCFMAELLPARAKHAKIQVTRVMSVMGRAMQVFGMHARVDKGQVTQVPFDDRELLNVNC